MNIEWTSAEAAFREEVRDFFATHLTDDLREAGKLMTSAYADHDASLRMQALLHSRGWAAPAWPVEYGGCDWSVAQHYIFASEYARAHAPPLSPMGIRMCAPALIAFGTQQQKEFFLPRILTAEHFWCQGYSEPGSGSDLASLQMAAVEDGDDFICNGTKIWTTHAQEANWIFCLVRNAKEARPQQGITFLLIEMSSPGTEVRPIVGYSGEHIQNQVFFTDVRVPKSNVVGKIGEGWSVAKYLLEFERGGTAYAPEIQARIEVLREFAAELLDEPLFAAKVARASIRASAMEMYELQSLSRLHAGERPGVAASVMKTLGTELAQHVAELFLEAAGQRGRTFQPQGTRPGGPVYYAHSKAPAVGAPQAIVAPLRYLNERAGSIYAGSNEIQRNIIAKAALGL